MYRETPNVKPRLAQKASVMQKWNAVADKLIAANCAVVHISRTDPLFTVNKDAL